MRANSLATPVFFEFSELLDEEFDSDNKRPFRRKPLTDNIVLLCDVKSWDDEFDNDDMLCELQD